MGTRVSSRISEVITKPARRCAFSEKARYPKPVPARAKGAVGDCTLLLRPLLNALPLNALLLPELLRPSFVGCMLRCWAIAGA